MRTKSKAVSAKGLRTNIQLFQKLIATHPVRAENVSGLGGSRSGFEVKWCALSNEEVIKSLEEIAWDIAGNPIQAEINYLSEKKPVASWLLLAPQLRSDEGAGTWSVGKERFTCIRRERLMNTRFNVFSTPQHVRFVQWLVGDHDDTNETYVTHLQPDKRRGVLLLYPTKGWDWEDSRPPAMGFALAIATVADKKTVFRVKM